MSKRYFDHVYTEICVAVQRRVSRYELWLLVWDAGGDPDDLSHEQVRFFVENGLDSLLREEGTPIEGRSRRSLEKRLLSFDPTHPTPEEWMTGLVERIRSNP